MWRTNYYIYRATFTPLESRAINPKADMRDSNHNHVSLVEAFPGDDCSYLTDEHYRRMGVVELSQLRNELWHSGKPLDLNKLFFPEIEAWQAGKEFPTLLSDYVTLVQKVRAESDTIAITKDEILRSASSFKEYALDQIEKNRQMLNQMRTKDTAGFTMGWNPRTRLFAEQVGVKLEDDTVFNQPEQLTVSGQGQIANSVNTEQKAKELELQEEANRLKREELEFLKAQYAAKEDTKFTKAK